jgi:hypothetical protein
MPPTKIEKDVIWAEEGREIIFINLSLIVLPTIQNLKEKAIV